MADRTLRLYLEDIREAIGLIEQYCHARQRQDLDREPMLRQAIERNIEIISEASRRVPAAMKTRHAEVPWRDIAAIGNILRHEYPAVNRDIIWRIRDRGHAAARRRGQPPRRGPARLEEVRWPTPRPRWSRCTRPPSSGGTEPIHEDHL